MKKFAVVSLLAACAFGISAQEVSFDSQNEAYLGVRLGLDISCPGNVNRPSAIEPNTQISTDMFNNGAGFDLGVVYNIPLFMNLYFEPGVSLYYNTMGVNSNDAGTDLLPDYIEETSSSIRRLGLRIPLQIGYHADFDNFKISLFTGPVISTGLYGRSHFSGKLQDGWEVTKGVNCYKDSADPSLNRFDIGWKIGLGASFGSYVVQLSGTFGMCDMYKSSDGGKFHDNNVALTVGYNFEL